MSCIFGHQVAQLWLVQNLVIRWRHLHCLQSWPPACVTCTTCIGHQAAMPHCLELRYWHYQLELSLCLHQPESHQLSLQKVLELCSLKVCSCFLLFLLVTWLNNSHNPKHPLLGWGCCYAWPGSFRTILILFWVLWFYHPHIAIKSLDSRKLGTQRLCRNQKPKK